MEKPYIHCGYTEAVLKSVDHLCFRAKIRKNTPLLTPVLLYKSGLYWSLNDTGDYRDVL